LLNNKQVSENSSLYLWSLLSLQLPYPTRKNPYFMPFRNKKGEIGEMQKFLSKLHKISTVSSCNSLIHKKIPFQCSTFDTTFHKNDNCIIYGNLFRTYPILLPTLTENKTHKYHNSGVTTCVFSFFQCLHVHTFFALVKCFCTCTCTNEQ